jgi:type VI secretion system protein ImpF
MKTTSPQIRASLIDRLVDVAPRSSREQRPLRAHDRAAMRASVRRDLGWLLNTRTPLPGEAFDRRELTVIDYGIPDFGSYSPESISDMKLMARRIGRAIAAFEPRLQNVSIGFRKEMDNERSLGAMIEADLVIDEVREPVSFLTVFQQETGQVNVYDNQA